MGVSKENGRAMKSQMTEYSNRMFMRSGMFCRLAFMLTFVFPFVGQGGWLASYSSRGVDCYADGTPVADGECYALVFTKQGCEFSGFKADGSLVNPQNDSVALLMPLAENGRCPLVTLKLDENYMLDHANDSKAVYLLDTRRADGVPAGTDGSRPLRVNRYSRLPDSSLSVKQTSQRVGPGLMAAGASTSGSVILKADSAADQRDVPKPVITSVRVEDGVMIIRARETVDYVTYGVLGGADPAVLTESVAERPQDGETALEREIELRVPVTEKAKFARVADRVTIENRELSVQ